MNELLAAIGTVVASGVAWLVRRFWLGRNDGIEELSREELGSEDGFCGSVCGGYGDMMSIVDTQRESYEHLSGLYDRVQDELLLCRTNLAASERHRLMLERALVEAAARIEELERASAPEA